MSDRTALKLSELATIITGSTPAAADTDSWGDHVDFITPSDQYFGMRTAAPARRLSAVGVRRLSKRLIPPLATNLTCIGATIGKVTMCTDACITNQQINSLVAREGVADPLYLYYLIKNWSFGLGSAASGSATPIVNKKVLSNFEFVVPPVPEQRAIAEVLGAFDDKIAANTKLAHTADQLAGTIFDAASLTAPRQTMNAVLNPVLGGTPARSRTEYWSGGNPWASARDVTSAPLGVMLDTEESISDEAVSSTKAKPLGAGSVILTARGTVGAVARLGVPASFNQSCYGFVPGTLSPAILYFSIVRATQQAKAIAHGSVFDTITMKTFNHLTIPSFPVANRRPLEGRIAPLLHLVDQNMQENSLLAQTRDALLPHLMSGRLRVRDAEKQVEEMV